MMKRIRFHWSVKRCSCQGVHHCSSHLVLIESGAGLQLFYLCVPMQVEIQTKDIDWWDYTGNGDGDKNGARWRWQKRIRFHQIIKSPVKVFITVAASCTYESVQDYGSSVHAKKCTSRYKFKQTDDVVEIAQTTEVKNRMKMMGKTMKWIRFNQLIKTRAKVFIIPAATLYLLIRFRT